MCRDDLGACRPIGNRSFKEQTGPNQIRSFLWSLEQFGFAKDQFPQDPLGFGLREDQKTKTKTELALSQTPLFR